MRSKFYLQIKNLSIKFKNFFLKNISFSLNKGDYLTIIGPTGAGKTILLETILGIYKPEKGSIIVNGKNITNLPSEKRNIGIIYQDYALFPHFNVRKNIAYGLKVKDKNKVEHISNLLEISHLLERKPDTLSGGEKQRVALARALIVEPQLLLMDEPFSALDNYTKHKIRNLVREIAKKFNITVIHITHDLDDVWALANKVAIIKEGKLIQFGSIDEIMFKPVDEFIAQFTGNNVLEGKVISEKQNLSIIEIEENVKISSIDLVEKGKNVKIAIPPESIIILKNKPDKSSARNVIEAEFEDFFVENRVYFLVLRIKNKKLKAAITLSSFEDLKLRKGYKLYLAIKATNVRII